MGTYTHFIYEGIIKKEYIEMFKKVFDSKDTEEGYEYTWIDAFNEYKYPFLKEFIEHYSSILIRGKIDNDGKCIIDCNIRYGAEIEIFIYDILSITSAETSICKSHCEEWDENDPYWKIYKSNEMIESIKTTCPQCGHQWLYKGQHVKKIQNNEKVRMFCPACARFFMLNKTPPQTSRIKRFIDILYVYTIEKSQLNDYSMKYRETLYSLEEKRLAQKLKEFNLNEEYIRKIAIIFESF